MAEKSLDLVEWDIVHGQIRRGVRGEEARGQKHRTPSYGRGSESAPTRTRTWNPLIKRVERSRHCESGSTASAIAVESGAESKR